MGKLGCRTLATTRFVRGPLRDPTEHVALAHHPPDARSCDGCNHGPTTSSTGERLTLQDALNGAAPGFLAAALGFGPATSWLAARRQRNPAIWLLFGALIGPLALLLVYLAPPARCPACGEATAGFGRVCTTCGADLRSPGSTPPAARDDAIAPARVTMPIPVMDAPTLPAPRLGSVTPVAVGPGSDAQHPLPDRLAAIGARRPGPVSADSGVMSRAAASVSGRLGLTMIAIGVFVRGSETLAPGSRYLVARTVDRLIIVGPLEPAHDHLELDLPLAGLEADYIADRLVISGTQDGRGQRRFILAFQGVVSLAARAVDDALLEHRGTLVDPVRTS